ncbi:uncharacterized protein LOC142925113 [Petromyzon marinus]|uniref:uncharacterized protein LOC142925113 n=1 Tax=Petromyzon marinus TaxID=7757 RepID=UPI003F71A9BD
MRSNPKKTCIIDDIGRESLHVKLVVLHWFTRCTLIDTVFLFEGCGADEFHCGGGECIPSGYRCDGDADCPDGSDEGRCTDCPPDSFQCGNGACTSPSFVCDGADDCGDYSDEQNCSCGNDEFHCGSGECVQLIYRCDGDTDCPDGSDEARCTDCPPDSFQCGNGACTSPSFVCDGADDCGDYSDEQNCSEWNNHEVINIADHSAWSHRPHSATPLAGSVRMMAMETTQEIFHLAVSGGGGFNDTFIFMRSNPKKTCIIDDIGRESLHVKLVVLHWFTRCTLIDTVFLFEGCGADEFRCGGGECIPSGYRCDGDADCPDGSDEGRCTDCPADSFQCGNGACTSLSFVCDGADDCGDYSDEQNCSCAIGEFSCGGGQCIPSLYRCDGDADCPDGSDESHCTDCPPDSFQCGNGACTSPSFVCDGADDCGDYSDEQNCSEL